MDQMWLDLVAAKATDPQLMMINGLLLATILFLMAIIVADWD
jgi:hypothetical protein